MYETHSIATEEQTGILAEPSKETDLQLPLDDIEVLNSDLAVPTCKATYCQTTYNDMGQ